LRRYALWAEQTKLLHDELLAIDQAGSGVPAADNGWVWVPWWAATSKSAVDDPDGSLGRECGARILDSR
jgi:hypothetical protein